MPDVRLAQAAALAGIAGLAFYRGIPGTVGGALRMNAGAHGGETKNVLVEARAVDRSGNIDVFDNAGLGFNYRHCAFRPISFSPMPFLKVGRACRRRSSARCEASPSIAKRISP